MKVDGFCITAAKITFNFLSISNAKPGCNKALSRIAGVTSFCMKDIEHNNVISSADAHRLWNTVFLLKNTFLHWKYRHQKICHQTHY